MLESEILSDKLLSNVIYRLYAKSGSSGFGSSTLVALVTLAYSPNSSMYIILPGVNQAFNSSSSG